MSHLCIVSMSCLSTSCLPTDAVALLHARFMVTETSVKISAVTAKCAFGNLQTNACGALLHESPLIMFQHAVRCQH